MTMARGSIFKHVLTEGDKILLSFASATDKGIYVLVQNYGRCISSPSSVCGQLTKKPY